MAQSNRTRPEVIVDKNGKITTVHRANEQAGKNSARLSGLGHRSSRVVDGVEKKVLQFSTAETAVLIRETLKDEFKADYPNVKFSVRSSSYSGGSSINISYVDGPPESEVEAFSELYAGATFNGMIDLKEYKQSAKNADGTNVVYGPDFVFVRREMSPEAAVAAKSELAGYLGHPITDDHVFVETPHQMDDMYEKNGLRRRYDATVYELMNVIATNNANVNK